MSDVAQWIGSPEIDDGVVALVVVVEPPRAAGNGRCSVGTKLERSFPRNTVRIFTDSVIASTYARRSYRKNVRLAEKGRSRTFRSPRESLGSSTSCSSYSLVFRLRSD